MRNVRIFRFLVVTQIFLLFITFFFALDATPLSWKSIIEEIYSYKTTLSRQTFGILLWINLALSLIANIGLLYFRNWARHLFIALAINGLAITMLFGGWVVIGPMSRVVWSCSIYICGAVIALAYFSELRSHFRGVV
jgi:hypothetical protein